MQRIPHDAECYICGAVGALQRHHKDWNHGNNASENILIVCQECHSRLHSISGYLDDGELLELREMRVNGQASRPFRMHLEMLKAQELSDGTDA